ncbi:MAG: cytochrome c oxidase subunit II [Alphaproteobacteria bacterium]|nr:cytochrome c oxidase subunit II [Alphaproteobacteria bacterium]
MWIPLWPASSAISGNVINALFTAELVVCVLILALVFGLIWVFCIRYRHSTTVDRGHPSQRSWVFEIGWTSATLVAFLVLFVWGANAYVWLYEPPRADLELYVVGKQWMWEIEHPGGQREINALHVPNGKIVRLVMASQDVIHSFFIPAFRMKHDVVPGQLETMWFQPTQTGTYRLECTEFCGTEHAHMTGEVIVMTPAAYAEWLSNQGADKTLAAQGEQLFRNYGCSGCHGVNSTVHAPSLVGLYGSLVHLNDGTTVRADERYIRDSILLPRSQVVAGFAPVMPSFSGQISEADTLKILAYIQSLNPSGNAP